MKKMLHIIGLTAAVLSMGMASVSAPVLPGSAHEALYSIAFHQDKGIAVGAAGELLESADAGKTWKAVTPAPTVLALLGVGLSQGHAIIVGQQGLVLVMNSDGHWQSVDSGTKQRLLGVAVNNDGLAVAVGAFGTLLRSLDGGKTWISIAPDWAPYTETGERPHFYAAAVNDSGKITVAGEFGLILISDDGGKSWKTVHKGDQTSPSLFAMQLRADGIGYAVGQSGTVLRTANHGATWDAVDSGTASALLGVYSDQDGWVVATGMHDIVDSHDAGKTWEHAQGKEIASKWLQGVTSPAQGQPLLAVGESGRMVRIYGN